RVVRDRAGRGGRVLDLILKHGSDPPPMPVASNADAFTEWAAGHLLSPAYVFSAYPGPTVKEIQAMASAAGVEGRTQMLPFLVILPAKGRLAFAEMQLILRTMAMTGKVDRDMTSVGTPHFAQFVPLEDQQLGFFTVYDGAFDKYIMDFTRNIGEVFDLIFKFTKDPPPSPCRKHVQEFIDFAAGASRDPIGFYQAYPGLSNQDIKALIADSGTKPAGALPPPGRGAVNQDSNTRSPTRERREGLLHHLFERIEGRVQPTGITKAALDLEDIQGLILRGYRMPMVRHVLLKVNAPAAARKLFGRLVSGDEADVPQLTTAKDWHVGFEPGPGDDLTSAPRCKPDYCLNVGITWPGLLALEIKDRFPNLSFKSFNA